MPAKTICPKCSGTGVAGYETTWPCPWCGGAGTVEPAAPTLPEPRPDDEGRETIERAYITGYLDGYDAVDERSLEKRRAIAESSATAYADQRRALTPHPAPLGATRSMTPEEVESQKQFRRSISRPLGATDEGLRAARDAWRDFAQHQTWCATCAESVADCPIGAPLQEAAAAAEGALQTEPNR